MKLFYMFIICNKNILAIYFYLEKYIKNIHLENNIHIINY